jgi:hypothetical protein
MKSLKLRFVLLFTATVVTVGLSNVAAHAACTHREVGGNAYGDYDCKLTSSCSGSCYYDCTCSNLFPGFTCDNVLDEAGFVEVAFIPCND